MSSATVVIILSFTAGSAFVMWLGEQITEFGIGNGISIILFANIISRLPSGISTMVTNVANGGLAWYGCSAASGRHPGADRRSLSL